MFKFFTKIVESKSNKTILCMIHMPMFVLVGGFEITVGVPFSSLVDFPRGLHGFFYHSLHPSRLQV